MDKFDFTAQLPGKRMAAGALLRDSKSRLLVVRPTYRDHWLLPGGIVEAHESPGTACLREVREELGLEVRINRLLCLEYQSTAPPKTESLQFIFDCGVLSADQSQQIILPPHELSAHAFVSLEEAQPLLEPRSARRIRWAWQALQEQRMLYAEDGVPQAS